MSTPTKPTTPTEARATLALPSVQKALADYRVFTSGPDDAEDESDRLPFLAEQQGITLPAEWDTPPEAPPAQESADLLTESQELWNCATTALAMLERYDSATADAIRADFAKALKRPEITKSEGGAL